MITSNVQIILLASPSGENANYNRGPSRCHS